MHAGRVQSLERRIAVVWRFKLTAAGRCLLAGLLVSGSVGSASLEIPVYHLFCALFTLLIVCYLGAIRYRPTIRIAGTMPEKAEAGQLVRSVYTVTNCGTRVAYDVGVRHSVLPPEVSDSGEHEPIVDQLNPGESVTVPVLLKASKRGLYWIEPPVPYTRYPFNFFRVPARIPSQGHALFPSKLIVTPAFHPVTHVDVPIGSRYQPGGIALTSSIGESPEYIGNRDYRPGDSARRIDFRAWGRLAKPVVREYQEEYYNRIGLVFDTSMPTPRGRRAKAAEPFESAVSLAASLADAMAQGEYIVDLFAAGSKLYVFRAGRHTAHLDNILEILSCVEPSSGDAFGSVLPDMVNELPSISALLCVFLSWDSARNALVQAAREAGCSVRVYLVQDTPDVPLTEDAPMDSILPITPEQIRFGFVDRL
ncbi:MAG: hypothetical protein AMXMBFR84_29670 [Candidatus Hydrogenedentota bacterium]